MIIHQLHLLDVVLVLLLNGLLELVFQLFFIRDDVLAFDDLLFDVLIKLLAILLFFEFLPIPINFDIFLVGGNDLVLNLIGTLAFLLFFLDAAFVLNVIGVSLDRGDCLVGLTTDLFQES